MDSRTTWPALIGALIRGEHLAPDETAWAMNEIMDGAATPAQIAGFGVALRIKGETTGEVTGLAQAMLEHASPISIPGRTVDLVGTGADGARTVNISTMGTFAAAAAGARMIKHGNRAASSACGTADVLEALGVIIDLPAPATEQLVAEIGAGFLFAPLYHPALRHVIVPRRELGVPTVFNVLGPVANPARPAAQALGVADPRMGPVLAGPSDIGIARSEPGDLRGGDPAHNAGVAREFLAGRPGPIRDTALLNAGAALAAEAGVGSPDGLVPALADGYQRAAAAVDSGAAADLLARWVSASQRLAGR